MSPPPKGEGVKETFIKNKKKINKNLIQINLIIHPKIE